MMVRRSALIAVAAAGALALGAVAGCTLTGAAEQESTAQSSTSSMRSASFVLDCTAGQPISPLIYGVGGSGGAPWDSGTTARRWGGNPTTRYNWERNVYNISKDWFFKNAQGSPSSYRGFLEENRQYGVKTAMTVPILGWVSKDASSYSFPVSRFGPQQATAPESADIGNGVAPDGKPIAPGPPDITSVPSTPDSVARWIRDIRKGDGTRGRSVDSYILDNEPMLWNSTHRDVHPDPVSYEELLEKTIAYGTAIRKADPDAKIAGPAAWGWLGYHYSAVDVAAGVALRPDRRKHGDEPLLPWYLSKVREYEKSSGTKILDIVDVHFYPMGDGIGIGTGGKTDPATSALRIRSTRSLWDPTYKDESWINERMRVLPLMHEWIEAYDPGLGLSIGEWNFGAENHMSGGLAVAEALGHFGLEGVTSAYYWTNPPDNSPAFWAFRAFRNFDAMGGRFLDWSVPVKGTGILTSVFASRDSDRHHVVVVLLNLSAVSPSTSGLTLEGCGAITSARAFNYPGGVAGFSPVVLASKQPLAVSAAPYSITVVDITTGPAGLTPPGADAGGRSGPGDPPGPRR